MNITLTAEATLHPLVLPARADAADAAVFREYTEVRNAAIADVTGRDDDAFTPEALLPLLRSDDDARREQWYVVDSGTMVGTAALKIPADGDGRTAFITVGLRREVWGRGIGSAVLEQVESQARTAGVRRLLHWAEHVDGGEDRLESPTGFGAIPRDHSARFLLRHGYSFEQVERVSTLTWDADIVQRLRDLLADAERHAHEYRVVQWTLPTPPERAAGYAWLKRHMSTDAPDADLEMPEEVWDAERVSRHDALYLERGSTVLVTAAEHIGTGELCAYNELEIGRDRTAVTHQEDTLVLSAHRGHRLGLLVKAAGLLAWREREPHSPHVITYNAEENRPMLSINEAIGFAPIAYVGAWKKDIA